MSNIVSPASSENSNPGLAAQRDTPGVVTRGRGRPKKAKRTANDDETVEASLAASEIAATQISRGDEKSLFSQLMKAAASSKSSNTTSSASIAIITKIVDNWAEEYDNSRSDGLQKIIQFIMHSAGCKGKVDKTLYESHIGAGFSNLITRMVENYDEENAEYPFVISNAAYRKFKLAFHEIISILVKQCQRDIIYDAYLMDNVIQLLTEMCNSKVRAFRHTSSLASMKLMTALVKVALTLHGNLETTNRSLETEEKKTARQRSANKIKALNSRKKELEDQSSEIEDMLNSIFKGIFAHRYRDVVAEVRACCMEEIGNWMHIFPKVFLTDSYLKYVGWTLNDKVKDVRIKCLNSLLNLYRENDLYKELSLFTKRFKSRLISMTADKENDVAVLATRLCTTILQNFKEEEIFTTEECESVYMLVFCNHRPLACAAADFLWVKIFAKDADSIANSESNDTTSTSKKSKNSSKVKRRSKRIPLLTTLVYFYIESELHEHTRYLVDALWDTPASALLRDWPAMTDLLLEEPEEGEEKLESNAETALIDLLLSTVVHASKGPPPARTGVPKRSNMTVKEKNKIEADIQSYTEHFIAVLPDLITKYQADPDRLNLLLQIPRYFDLSCYQENRSEASLDTLLEQLANVIQINGQDNVLENCSRIFELLCDNSDDLFYITQRASMRRDLAADRLANNFSNSREEYRSIKADIAAIETSMINDTTITDNKDVLLNKEQDAAYSTLMWLKRYSKLSVYNDINEAAKQGGQDMAEICLNLIKSQQDLDNTENTTSINEGATDVQTPAPILTEALKVVFSDCQWRLIKLLKQADAPSDDEIENLQKHSENVFNILHFCLCQKHESVSELREAAYTCTCDLLQAFGPTLTDHSDLSCYDRACLKPLTFICNERMVFDLVSFIRDRCFKDTEKEDEKYVKENLRTEDEQIAAKIEIVHIRRKLLAGLCKLVVYRRVPMKTASAIFSNYIRSFTDYGDVIKHTISKCREINQIELAKTLVMALIELFEEIQENEKSSGQNKQIDLGTQDFNHIKELGRRFSLTFGLEQYKIRDAIASLHKDGIDFALKGWPKIINGEEQLQFSPKNSAFFDILQEFSGKLMKQDRQVVLEYLRKCIEGSGNRRQANFIWQSTDKHWIPIVSYRNSLNQAGSFDKQDRRRSRYDSGKTINMDDMDDLSMPPSAFRQDETSNHVDTLTANTPVPRANSTAVK